MEWESLRCGDIQLKLADLIFSRGNSLFGKSILWATTGKGENFSIAHHVLGVTDKIGCNYKITEALGKVRESDFYSSYANNEQEVIIFRNKKMTDTERSIVSCDVRKSIGKIYSPVRIVGQFIDSMFSKILPWRVSYFDRISIPFSEICSVLWSESYGKIGIEFGINPKSANPDDMLDWCITHPDQWECVFISNDFLPKDFTPQSLKSTFA